MPFLLMYVSFDFIQEIISGRDLSSEIFGCQSKILLAFDTSGELLLKSLEKPLIRRYLKGLLTPANLWIFFAKSKMLISSFPIFISSLIALLFSSAITIALDISLACVKHRVCLPVPRISIGYCPDKVFFIKSGIT